MPYVAKFSQQANILDFLPYASWGAGNYQVVIDTPGKGDDIAAWLAGGGRGTLGNRVQSGRSLTIPAREIVFTEQGQYNGVPGIMPGSPGLNIRFANRWSIIGQGRGVSRLTVPAGSELACLSVSDCNHWRIQGVSTHGKRTTMPSSGYHNLRIGGGCFDFQVVDFGSFESPGYGIGCQANGTSDSVFVSGTFEDFYIEGCGNDGFDWKNPLGLNDRIQISNGTIKNWRRNGITGECAGLDLRQPTQVFNLWFIQEDLSGGRSVDSSALRFRFSGADQARQSVAKNIHIYMTTHPDNVTSDEPNVGIDMEASNCEVSGYEIFNCDYGIQQGTGQGNIMGGGIIDGCRIGVLGLDAQAMLGMTKIANSAVKDTQFTNGVRISDSRLLSDVSPYNEIIFAEQQTTGLSGFVRSAASEIEWVTDGTSRMKFKANGRFEFTNLPSFPDDTAAAAGGVEVGEVYHAGGSIRIRIQ